jgi:hypothetical protein
MSSRTWSVRSARLLEDEKLGSVVLRLMLARNVVAFHYEPKLMLRHLQKLVEKWPDHSTMYSLGSETLDWYFELGDLVADQITVREVFKIPEEADLKKAAFEVLDRLHKIGTAFTDFAGYFIRACCSK